MLPERISDVVADIPGLLRPEDELKLYELAQQTAGPILEIGTYRGKSTTIMALGAEAGAGAFIVSVDVDPAAQRAAHSALEAHGVAHRVVLVRGSSAGALRRFRDFRPSLTFVDGDHSTAGVLRDLASLEPHVPVGGQVLFHDFADERNEDPADSTIGVKDGIAASWVSTQCEFLGAFGACGLFQRHGGGPTRQSAPIVDATWRDPLRMQYLQRLRWPAGRLARRLLGR